MDKNSIKFLFKNGSPPEQKLTKNAYGNNFSAIFWKSSRERYLASPESY
jgi:hypothetical protein